MTLCLLQQVLKQIPRRRFRSIVERHEADKWVKSFSCWDQLVAMVYAQLSGQRSLRDLAASFNAEPGRHYHLGCGQLKRSTLSDANSQRPVAVFEELLAFLLARLGKAQVREAGQVLRILDSTVISLSAKMHRWAAFRVNNAAIKLHLLFDPDEQCPTFFEITPARLHDSRLCEQLPIAAGTTYVFDRAYNKAEFWADIDAAGAHFVTRPKVNLAYDVQQSYLHYDSYVVADETILLAGQPGKKYSKPLRRIEVFDEEQGRELAFITNDFERSAEDIADLYRRRWQIELFFKWIKQNLELKRFMAKNPKAVRVQIVIALIAFVLLKMLHQTKQIKSPLKRLAALCKNAIFNQKDIKELIEPPPNKAKITTPPQLALNFPGQ